MMKYDQVWALGIYMLTLTARINAHIIDPSLPNNRRNPESLDKIFHIKFLQFMKEDRLDFTMFYIQGDPNLSTPVHRKIWKTLDENDDVASKYSQFKNYLPNMEVPDLKIKYWRFFS